MVRCPVCGKDNPDKQRLCFWCGFDLKEVKVARYETRKPEVPVAKSTPLKTRQPPTPTKTKDAKRSRNYIGAIVSVLSVAILMYLLMVIELFPTTQYTPSEEFPSEGSSQQQQLSAPTLKTVGTDGLTTDTSPFLDWSSVSGALNYEVQVDNASSFANPIIDTTSNYSFYICSSLSPGTYYWRVRAVDSNGNYGSWASGSFIVESPTTIPEENTTISENGDYLFVHHEWDYSGSRWTYDSQIPKTTYEYFSTQSRATPSEFSELYTFAHYTEYVDNPTDDEWMENLADKFVDDAEEGGWDEFKTINFVLAFVQSWPSISDNVTTEHDEYPRYPIETIVDEGGDCEDTSILFASLMRGMGYGTVLIYLPGDAHMAVGVQVSQDFVDNWSQNLVSNWGQYYPFISYASNGNKYAYCETTAEGYLLGHMPDEIGGAAYVTPI